MTINATVWQKTDNLLPVTIPGDLSGYSVIAYRIGKRLRDSTTLEVTTSASANGSVVGAGSYDGTTETTFNITLARDDMQIAAMRYVHELILQDGSGNQQNVLTDSADEDAYLTVKETLPAA